MKSETHPQGSRIEENQAARFTKGAEEANDRCDSEKSIVDNAEDGCALRLIHFRLFDVKEHFMSET